MAAVPAQAQWSDDPSQNLVVADRPTGQAQPKIVPAGDGGFYVSWFGGGGDGYDVYLQRLDAAGKPVWADNGIRVADRSFSSTEDYGLAVDDAGHALLAFRFPDSGGVTQIVAQRVSPAGELLWDAPGVFVSYGTSAAASPRIASTGGGTAAVGWTSFGSGGTVLQRLNPAGEPMWDNGVLLTTPTGFFFLADLHGDADGNVIMGGNAQLSNFDRRLWTQKISGVDGSLMWGEGHVQVFDGSDGALQFGYFPGFVPDGSGGAVFGWYQVGGVGEGRVRVQHILADGSAAFPQNGVEAAIGGGRQRLAPGVSYDAASGDIYVVWPEEEQIGAAPRTYGVAAQRVDADGERQWGDAGVQVVPMGDAQASQAVALALDGAGIFAWARGTSPNPMRIDAARVDADGTFAWDGDTVNLKAPAGSTSRMRGALSSAGFAAYVWAGGPGGDAQNDILAQNVSFTGELGPVSVGTPLASVDPLEVTFNMSPDETASATITISNDAAAGGAGLNYTASVHAANTVLVHFEDGEVPYGITLGIPQAEIVMESGGNPGAWLRNDVLVTFAPALYLPDEEGSPFVGDFIERRVQAIGVDAITVATSNTVAGRPFSLMLIDHRGQPGNPEAHVYVYYPGPLVPLTGQGWEKYMFEIPWDYEGTIPPGWSGGHYGDLENLPAGVTWADVISSVDEVQLKWGHPAFFYLLQDFDIGVDNVQIVYESDEPGALTLDPASGNVLAGASGEMTLSMDTEGFEGGIYAYEVRIETNDPDSPLLTVQVTVNVAAVSTEDGGAPLAFDLRQNYPNPFSTSSTIEFDMPRAGPVTLAVYDLVGRRVATLVDREMEAGIHRVQWDASALAAGTYLYRIQSGHETRTLRALVLN